ncbi:calcium-binding protein [uncultured Amaricoccus sp.]|uniref:calcium-binding protein n=1 Tax=uncultured Amaricoccus sp. TaxID=339341 RepID=UPI0026032427|nr:calcium-binding protein [uncultured Amaricoccus sp.]
MARFTGTDAADRILLDFLSPGVTSDPAGLTGTGGEFNLIYGGGGADYIQTYGGDVYGGSGNDSLFGGSSSDNLYGEDGSDRLNSGDAAAGFEFVNGGTGADRMFGGEGLQVYVVDSYDDVVKDFGTSAGEQQFGEDWDVSDSIVTDLNYKLSEKAGVEVLYLGMEQWGLPATRKTVYGGGNSHDNFINGNEFGNVLEGFRGDDTLLGGAGRDLLLGGKGNDGIQGDDGNDVVRGQDGADNVSGGAGKDKLIGGKGRDTFVFGVADESVKGARDAIVAGDGAVAFEGAGAAAGDLIWMPNAPTADSPPEDHFVDDFGAFTFGGTGKGQVSCIDYGRNTLVRANIDDDSSFEFELLIKDGAVRAHAYTADDFFLGP